MKLPETSFFTYALDLQPDGALFYTPVTVYMKNTLGFDAYTQIPIGVWNDQTLEWEATGSLAAVDGTGQWIEFQTEHFSSSDINFPPPTGTGKQYER